MVKYSFFDVIRNGLSFMFTRIFFPKARLIRLPLFRSGPKFCYKKGLTMGRGCRIDVGSGRYSLTIGKDARIGDYVHINAEKEVVIGDNVLMASKIFISDASHGSYSGDIQDLPNTIPSLRELVVKPVKIGDNVWIGENVVILQGTIVGDGCIIGANSVLNGKEYPNNSIIVGAPAKVIKKFNPNTNVWEKLL